MAASTNRCFVTSSVPKRPTPFDAHRAYKVVEEPYLDFPFEPVAHRSVPIAAALTELLRPAIEGPAPAFVFNGNHRGVGKSLLTDAVSNTTTGRDMPRRSCPRHEDEVEKVVGAYALQGTAHFSLDNVTGDFGGPTIDAVLSTTGDWEPRVLGKSEIGRDHQGRRPALLDDSPLGLPALGRVPPQDDHRGPCSGKASGDPQTDPAVATRHDSHLAGQVEGVHRVILLDVVPRAIDRSGRMLPRVVDRLLPPRTIGRRHTAFRSPRAGWIPVT